MSEKVNHTPLPWRAEWGYFGSQRRLFVVGPWGMDGLLTASDADSEFIVRAVNNHHAMLGLVEAAAEMLEADDRRSVVELRERMLAAVAKAKEPA